MSVRTLIKPSAIPDAVSDGHGVSWAMAKQWASQMIAKGRPTKEIVETRFIAKRARLHMQGVSDYQRWSLAAEFFLLAGRGKPSAEWGRYIGRGTWPGFHQVPIANKIPRHTANLADPMARLFASIHGNLKLMQCLVMRKKRCQADPRHRGIPEQGGDERRHQSG